MKVTYKHVNIYDYGYDGVVVSFTLKSDEETNEKKGDIHSSHVNKIKGKWCVFCQLFHRMCLAIDAVTPVLSLYNTKGGTHIPR